jgi:hypothetical protein
MSAKASASASAGELRVLDGIVTRVMREDGFAGSVNVTSAIIRKTGYSVKLDATVGTVTRKYRAFVPNAATASNKVWVTAL